MTPHLRFPSWFTGYRQFQEETIEDIVQHFQDGYDLVLLDGPVGSGKTLVAEMVGQYLQAHRLYVCTTKSLQAQFLKDFPWASLIMGRNNYQPVYIDAVPGDPDAPTCADCEGKNCRMCPGFLQCPYTEAKLDAKESPLAVLNTAYFLGESQSENSSFTDRDLVILDEADLLENELMRFVEVSISPRMQRILGLDPPKYKTVRESWESWLDDAIDVVADKKRRLPSETMKQRRLKDSINKLHQRMCRVADEKEHWVHSGWGRGRIEFKPITVDRHAPEMLWPHGKKFLAMSATIDPVQSFVESLGWDRPWQVVRTPSVFPVENRQIKYIPLAKVTRATQETAWPIMARGLEEVSERYEGKRVLVLPFSYRFAEYLRDNIDVDRDLFCYLNSRERDDAIAEYEATPGAMLIAASLNRGYDGVGDKVECVAIMKTPMPYLGDEQVKKRLYGTPGGKLWYAAETARSVMQSVGRGVRSELDVCDTLILDETFGQFYRRWRTPTGHKLFPMRFREAMVWVPPEREEVRQQARRRAASSSGT